MKNLLKIATVITMSLVCIVSAAQSRDELEALISRSQKEIEALNSLIDRNEAKIDNSERSRKLQVNKINAYREMIRNLDKQAAMLSSEITANTRQVRELDQQLETLRKDYGAFVYSAWKNHKMNNAVAFLFASRDFNDATRRISYMKRYNLMREKKGAEIDSISFVLQYEIEKLAQQKQERDNAIARQNAEKANAEKEEKKLSAMISNIRADSKKLKEQAQEHKNRIIKAQKQIDRIIAEQAKAAQKGRSQAQIEQDVKLSGKFEDNKGKLPWPISGGSVLHRFGRQTITSGVVNDFKGIEIAAPRGAVVKAVFEGEVTGVYNLDHINDCVMVRSGNYVILYANMARTNVNTGDKVAINQRLGTLFDTDDTDQHVLIFQIWRETTAVDPLLWLRK